MAASAQPPLPGHAGPGRRQTTTPGLLRALSWKSAALCCAEGAAHLSSSDHSPSSCRLAATPLILGPPRTSWASTRATAPSAPAATTAAQPAALLWVRFISTASSARRQSCGRRRRREQWRQGPVGHVINPSRMASARRAELPQEFWQPEACNGHFHHQLLHLLHSSDERLPRQQRQLRHQPADQPCRQDGRQVEGRHRCQHSTAAARAGPAAGLLTTTATKNITGVAAEAEVRHSLLSAAAGTLAAGAPVVATSGGSPVCTVTASSRASLSGQAKQTFSSTSSALWHGNSGRGPLQQSSSMALPSPPRQQERCPAQLAQPCQHGVPQRAQLAASLVQAPQVAHGLDGGACVGQRRSVLRRHLRRRLQRARLPQRPLERVGVDGGVVGVEASCSITVQQYNSTRMRGSQRGMPLRTPALRHWG